MRVSIVIPAKNEEKNIGACLDAIYTQNAPFEFEVIVIDSGSRDRTAEIVSSYPAKLVRIGEREFHHGRTRNLGASVAQGEFLVYLSADALPADRSWLQNLVADFDDPQVGAVYGRQLPKADATPERAFFMRYRYSDQREVKSGNSSYKPRYQQCQFSTVNGAIRRAAWAVTRFPEKLNAYEDIGIALRILGQGYTIVYQPAAPVYHSHNYSLFFSLQQYFDTGVVYNDLGIWDQNERQRMGSDGLRYFQDELRFLVAKGAWVRCPYVACYELARYLGILLGRNERLLPRSLKRRLSAHRLFG